MDFGFSSLKKTVKAFFIEGMALGAVFLADAFLREHEEDYDSVRLAIDMRIYYLTKNMLYQFDSILTKEKNYRHFCSGMFNLSAAAIIYPSHRLLKLDNNIAHIILSESCIYFGASTLRLLVEKKIEKQTFIQHLTINSGKLIGGAIGIFASLIPAFGIATPAFYWSGELFDVWQKREANELLNTVLLQPKSTVPIQVILAVVTKASFSFSNKKTPFPEFITDSLIGSSHRLIVDRLKINQIKPELPHSFVIKNQSSRIKGAEIGNKPKNQVMNHPRKNSLNHVQIELTNYVTPFNPAFFTNNQRAPIPDHQELYEHKENRI